MPTRNVVITDHQEELIAALEDAEAAMAAGDWVAYRPGLVDEIDRQEQDAATARTA